MGNRRNYQRFSAIIMIGLLLISMVMPQNLVLAQSEDNNDLIIESRDTENITEEDYEEYLSKRDKKLDKDVKSLEEGLDFRVDSKSEDTISFDGKIEKTILQELEKNNEVDVIIRMKDKINLNELMQKTTTMAKKEDRVSFVVNKLKSKSDSSQKQLLEQLQQLEIENKVKNINELWIINGISATVTKEALDELKMRKDVAKITHDFEVHAPEFNPTESKPNLPVWGVERVDAPKVWGDYGIKGKGIVVAIMDTGVDMDHEALKNNYRGRDGNHKYSWADFSTNNYNTPTDGHGHGTHVAGTAVGGGTGDLIGVAPGAEWIGVKIFNDQGASSASAIHNAFQWVLAPGGDTSKAPDVVNNSWGSSDPYRTEFLEGVRAWEAAGIFASFSAGNDGPGSQTVGSPGSFPEAFSVGATDNHDQIASFSSRGPITWTDESGETKTYIKPEVSAPGVAIYSALPNGGYGLNNGTSMASPHVAGAMALILEANNDLDFDDVTQLLIETVDQAEHMGQLPNNDFGHGIINVYNAVTEAAFAGTLKGTLKNQAGDGISGQLYFKEEDKVVPVDKSGDFDFKVREGNHTVIVSSFGYESLEVQVTIERDQIEEVHFTLEKSINHNVTGKVSLSSNNSPVKYAYIRVEGTPLPTYRTNDDGGFVIADLPEGEYSLVISGKGIRPVTEQIVVDRDLNLNIFVEQLIINSNKDWPTSKNNYQRNPVSEVDIDAEKLVRTWEADTPGEIVFSSPVISDGKVVFSTNSGNVIALDQNTGERLWTLRTALSNRSTPTIVDGIVYVAGGSDAQIHALNLETGLKIWSADVGFPAVYETPVYHDGVLYVSSHMDNNAKVIALHAETGEVLWEVNNGNGGFYGPTLGEGMLYVGAYDSKHLRALSLENGEEIWKVSVENEGFSSAPVYNDGVIYAVSNNFDAPSGTLRAFDANTGERLWESDSVGNTEAASPIVFDDLVVTTSAQYPVIKAFNKYTGELVWEAENGITAVNTGAVSSNGYLFMTDLSSTMKVYDVFTGERLYTYDLNSSSTSSIALADGQVIVADRDGIYSYTAYAEYTGTVIDEEGEPVENAQILIEEIGVNASTDGLGNFSLKTRPGEYKVKVFANGYKQIFEDVTLVSGFNVHRDYRLELAETGRIAGNVTDSRTGEAIEGMQISIAELEVESTTNSKGQFTFEEVYEGKFAINFYKSGYVDTTKEIVVKANENLELDVEISPVDVVVLHDYEDEITKFLNDSGIPAVSMEWEAVDELENYKVAYLNGTYRNSFNNPTEEQIRNIIEVAKQNDVNLIFADTWGPNYGSLRFLHLYLEDPANYDSFMSSGTGITTHVRADDEHPITKDLDLGVNYRAIDNAHLAWFTQYSGKEIVSVGTSRDGFTGSGIAYKGMSENSAHVLMSSHAASPWTSPYNGWTSVQQKLLLNTMEFLLDDLNYGSFKGNISDKDGNPLEDVNIELVEHAYHETTDDEGNFEVYFDEGTYDIVISKTGYATKRMEVEFIHGQPNIENIVLEISDSGTIAGTVLNKVNGAAVPYAEIFLYDEDGNLMEEEYVSNLGGSYEITNLDEGTYTIKVEERDFVYYSTEVNVTSTPLQLDIELYPVPEVAIIGDATLRNLRTLLSEHGIDATNYSDIASIIPEVEGLDVIFFNQQAAFSVKKEDLEELRRVTDLHGVSVIYGDDYYTGSPINHLVTHLNDPQERSQHSNRTNAAGYVILEEHPIFGDLQAGEFAEILIPNRSNIASFEGYSGYPLAEIKHAHLDETYGTSVAYKPRTAENMEILMSGHAVGTLRSYNEYTDVGQKMFINAIIWAAYTEFSEVSGYVVDEDGEPLLAEVGLTETGSTVWTDAEDGYFSFGSLDGDFELVVNSFGYDTHKKNIVVDESMEELTIVMKASKENGRVFGQIIDENTLEGIRDARVYIEDFPREALTDVSGSYSLERMTPGNYKLIIEAEDYVVQEFEVNVSEEESVEINRKLKPSPTVGVIVDSQSASAVSLEEYLTPKGFVVEKMYYTDLDRIAEMDLIIANSDYNSDLIPEEDEFIAFVKELDRTETPVVWTGHFGPRGSIRFLSDYLNDPKEEFSSRLSATDRNVVATKKVDHDILKDIVFDEDNDEQFTFYTDNVYGFRDYSGTTLVTSENSIEGDLGSLVAIGGRTINSVEVLLSTMTFGYGFTDGLEERKFFDENRESIFNNAILWTLDNKEALVGEVHGQVKNNLGNDVSATITVVENDYSVDTDRDGSFFLGLSEGDYTLRIDAFGHESQSFPVTVTNGKVSEKEFIVTSDNLGTIKGTVKSLETGESLKDARIRLIGTPLEAISDVNGQFELLAPADHYEIRISAAGHASQTLPVEVIYNETVTLNVNLGEAQGIALVGTSTTENRVMPFLESEGYEVDFWLNSKIDELMDQIDEYAVVLLNDRHTSNMNEEKFKEFIDLTDEHEVSVIFPSQWGSSPISDLRNFYGDPADVVNGFVPHYTKYAIKEEHPIFAGFNVGDEITILERDGSNVQYSVFENYSGTTIADLTHETGRIGSAVAYDFRTSNSVHVLLGSLRVGTYGHPEDRWTDDAKQIYMNAIDWAISASLGEIAGRVTDKDGNIIEGAIVEIPKANLSTSTNVNGEYTLGVGMGTYEVQVTAHGYVPNSAEATIEELGETVKLDFILEQTDRASVQGKVTNINGEGIADVEIILTEIADNTEYTKVTDDSGHYEFTDLVAGDYKLTVEARGYQTIEELFTLSEGENLTKNYSLSDYNIAVIDDFKSDLVTLFEEEGYAAQPREWDIVDDVFNYRVIVINSDDGNIEDLEKLIEEANKYETSLVFTETWASDGSIKLLEQVLGYPKLEQHGYNQGKVQVRFLQEHPIFEGFSTDEIVALAENSPYSTFSGFKGIDLAEIVVDEKNKGTAIAYDFQSENHMFMLLSSFQVNNMVGPERGWTDEGTQLFLQAVEWARDARQQLPEKPAWTEEEIIYTNDTVELTGRSDYRTWVTILSDGEEIQTVETKEDGSFTVEITELPEGEYELELQASNYAGTVMADDTITLIVDKTAPTLEIEEPKDQLITNKELVTIKGTVEDQHLDTVFINDEVIEVINGAFEKKVILEEGENQLIIKALDLAENETIKTRTVILTTEEPIVSEIEPSEDKFLTPGDNLYVSFVGSENAKASFTIQVPLLQNETTNNGIQMTEVEPGKYEGVWTVPTNLNLDGGIVQIHVIDEAGNSKTVEAAGKLYLSSDQIERIYGGSRFETAIEISKAGWTKANTVVLARNDDYADALAGVPLAHKLDAPILLTRTNLLPKETVEEIKRLQAENVVVLGGRLAISDDVVAELERNGLAVERVYGGTRYETAAEIAKHVVGEDTKKAFIVNGLDFPDALSIAPFAAINNIPILLTKPGELPAETTNALEEFNTIETLVIGGRLAISDEVMDQLPAPERIYGSSRIGTNIAIQNYFELDSPHMYVATGNEFADSLTGSVLAAKNNSAILLVRNTLAPETINYLQDKDIVKLTLFGGRLAISEEIENELGKYLRE